MNNYIKFRGWGTSLAWWANIDYPKDIKNELVKLLFSKDGLGLNIVRYNLGATNSKLKTELSSPRFLSCIKNGRDDDFEFENDRLQLSILDMAVNSGVNSVEIFANSPPWWMTKNNNSRGADTPFTTNLQSDYLNDYVDFLIDSFNILKEKYPVISLEPFNEPSNPFWTSNNGQEGCYFDYNTRNKILKLVKLKNPNIPLTAADSFSSGFALFWHLYCDNSTLDKINVHGYSLTWRGYRLYFDDLNLIRYLFRWIVKKPIWMSEFGIGGPNTIETGLNLAKQIFRDLYTLQPEAWIYWQAVEDISDNGWGLIQVPFNDPKKILIQKQYWVFKHFTQTLRENDYYTVTNNNVLKIINDKNKLAYIIIGKYDLIQFKDLNLTNIRITNNSLDYYELKTLPHNINENCIISFFVNIYFN